MKSAALVMGFGFGRANEDVADFVKARSRIRHFDWILAQVAVSGPLYQRGLQVMPMHQHHRRIHVDTLEAIGFGLLRLYEVAGDSGCDIELEVLAHERQFTRSSDAASFVLSWLRRSSSPEIEIFLQKMTLCQPKAPATMHWNLLRESCWQPWTCFLLLYTVADLWAKWRDFGRRNRQYEANPHAFYSDLKALEHRVAQNRLKDEQHFEQSSERYRAGMMQRQRKLSRCPKCREYRFFCIDTIEEEANPRLSWTHYIVEETWRCQTCGYQKRYRGGRK